MFLSEVCALLDKSQLIFLNDIIAKIYSIEDYTEMRISVLNMLNTLIPYMSSSYYLAANEKDHILASPVGVNISKDELIRYINDYEDKDYTRWIFMSGKSMVYRETDLFNDNIRANETYYKDVYLQSNIYYSAQMSITNNGEFLGIVSLYRNRESKDFSDEELFWLDLLRIHLENRAILEKGVKNLKNKSYFDAYHFIKNYALTTREVEILGLLFAGITNEMICSTLVISPNTLKKHAISIYKKLGINNRWELINFMR